MRSLGYTLLACVVLVLVTQTAKPKPNDQNTSTQEKLIGVWEATKGDAPPGSTLEFTRDGKIRVKVKADNKTPALEMEMTYKVEGDTFKAVFTPPGANKEMRQTLKIRTLTDTTLVTEDEEKKLDEFKRVQVLPVKAFKKHWGFINPAKPDR